MDTIILENQVEKELEMYLKLGAWKGYMGNPVSSVKWEKDISIMQNQMDKIIDSNMKAGVM